MRALVALVLLLAAAACRSSPPPATASLPPDPTLTLDDLQHRTPTLREPADFVKRGTMIENYRSGFVWNVMKKNPHVVRGLRRAGFRGGWLE